MEGVSVTVYKCMRDYWTRRDYSRLHSTTSGGAPETKRRKWGIKIGRKIRIRFTSPKSFLKRLRGAYINFMDQFGHSGFVGNGFSGLGSRSIKEYDEKMLVEIYKSLMKRHENGFLGDGGPNPQRKS